MKAGFKEVPRSPWEWVRKHVRFRACSVFGVSIFPFPILSREKYESHEGFRDTFLLNSNGN